jgi:hypothetical protein
VKIRLGAVALLFYVVGVTPNGEMGVGGVEPGDEYLEQVVFGVARRGVPQQGRRLPCGLLPVGVKRALRRVLKDHARVVAVRGERAEKRLGRWVPVQEVEAAAEQHGRHMVEAVD